LTGIVVRKEGCMQPIVLHPNAAPLYDFLARINLERPAASSSNPAKILDCGAGGPIPPLALFHQHGFEACGIDISPAELDKARQFALQRGLHLDLRQGDMRCIPFADASFDYVYEHYSMCHLNKPDTALAVREMHRVLKPGGLCFLGVISTDTWPRSIFGEERAPGEFWGEEGGVPNVLHSMFGDQEMDAIVSGWEVVNKQKHVHYLHAAAAETSREAWMELYPEAEDRPSAEEWVSRYEQRASFFRYTHLYYCLRRPPEST
jgi:ubiquinone/menaquinone biosynthesis C-methylase UbiE